MCQPLKVDSYSSAGNSSGGLTQVSPRSLHAQPKKSAIPDDDGFRFTTRSKRAQLLARYVVPSDARTGSSVSFVIGAPGRGWGHPCLCRAYRREHRQHRLLHHSFARWLLRPFLPCFAARHHGDEVSCSMCLCQRRRKDRSTVCHREFARLRVGSDLPCCAARLVEMGSPAAPVLARRWLYQCPLTTSQHCAGGGVRASCACTCIFLLRTDARAPSENTEGLLVELQWGGWGGQGGVERQPAGFVRISWAPSRSSQRRPLECVHRLPAPCPE